MTSPCDDESYTMLITDALRGDVNNVRSFLEDHNVTVDAIFHECPLLILASSMGHIELVEWLLHQGANPRLYDDENRTAFFVAAGGGYRDVAEVLFEQGGIDVDHVDIYGRTALDWACHKWKFVPTDSEEYKTIDATIEWLLYQGASLIPMDRNDVGTDQDGEIEGLMAQEVAGSPSLASSEPWPYFPCPESLRAESTLAPDMASTLDWKTHRRASFQFSAPGSLDESRNGVDSFDESLDVGEGSDGDYALEDEGLMPSEGEGDQNEEEGMREEKFDCIKICFDLIVRTWRNAGFGMPGLGPLPFVGI